MSRACDIAVVGSGPYGLSSAAHLAAADGFDIRVFGQPMSFWDTQMPTGMLLRSPWDGSHISDPARKYTLDSFRAHSKTAFSSPVPLSRFVEYGRWFQGKAVPQLDQRTVELVELAGEGFRLVLSDGESLQARRVVVAAGIGGFARRPPEFDGLPATHVSHSVEHRDLSQFKGRRVAVIGGGQSALESAALLHEEGAEVEVLVRDPLVRWLIRRWHHKIPGVSQLLYAPPDVGPAFVSWLVAMPQLYRKLPRNLQDRLAERSVRAAGSAWLVPRLADVPISTGLTVREAGQTNGSVRLRLDDGSERVVDHVLLATGYRVDATRYPFLGDDIVERMSHVGGYPKLDNGCQTSVDGLHVVGAPAAWSMGPLMRFVAGADFAARSLARGVVAATRRRHD